ncbi:Na+/H+ antiporter NhaA [Stagnihabitans tardus]|uniref:Na(+)/H(+) antiporter NhaA n=1 Tax=Stagnihabitans tardus TaxID=2699202 RepID=A0AAE4Y9G7_9RHOB|nr:Na+/H+ antiporter NhaA [Stagnihabitans tardus]NBZ88441.1 Na+/H+ antiporter NhaA [Stagnihabitans tardus]
MIDEESKNGGEALGGIVLIGATLLALVVANSPLAARYDAVLHAHFGLSILHWINDGLMAIFFLAVGMELKHEMVAGTLRDLRAVALPGLAALGGMVVPALIYLSISDATRGWAIPTATDIAFALGVLALAGKGFPPGLRTFLLTLAILDDLGAILVIALFYGKDLQVLWLASALLPLAGMVWWMRRGSDLVWPTLAMGAVLWLCVLQSGLHATLAGVITAFCLPAASRSGGHPLHDLQTRLASWVTFAIVPVFAFANAGLPLGELSLEGPGASLALAVGAGLLVGKFVGVVGMAWVAGLFGLRRPEGVTWGHLAAAGLLAGIGFTMSLFIGGLAFGEGDEMNAVRAGVLGASALAAVLGLTLLRILSGAARGKPV